MKTREKQMRHKLELKQIRDYLVRLVAGVTAILMFCNISYSQSNTPPSDQNETSCEEMAASISEAFISSNENTLIFIIFHAGKNEKQGSSHTRILAIAEYLKQAEIAEKFILAEGQKSKSQPYASIYVNGTLFHSIYFKSKSPRDFCD